MDEKNDTRIHDIFSCIGDFILIYLAFILTEALFVPIRSDQSTPFMIAFSLSWLIASLVSGFYQLKKHSLIRSITVKLIQTALIHFALIWALLAIFNTVHVTPTQFAALYGTMAVVMILSRFLYKLISKYVEFTGFDVRRIVIVGTTRSGKALYDYFNMHQSSGYIFCGFFDNYPNPSIVSRSFIKGTLDELPAFCTRENIDEIYFALPMKHRELLDWLTKYCDDNCIYLRLAPDFSDVIQKSHYVYVYDDIPVLTIRKEPLGIAANLWMKRIFDILFSLAVIVLIFPIVIPILVLAIRMDSPGPVIFKQLRPGKRNKLFECYKFRTMVVNNTTDQMATKNDKRVTRVGAFLRKKSLDELPQFINVLLGDMSVVGPRPNLISQLEEYSKTLKQYKIRHFVPPGITGYAQINGCRGELKDTESMARRVRYDVEYMENWSMLLDLKIIFQTVKKVVGGDEHAY